MSFILPDHIDPQHCLVTKQYAVYTPPMAEMIAQIGDWIDQQRPGGYIYGPSRFGKTKGVKWHLKEVLEERFESALPLIVWIRRPESQKSEGSFWHQILLASHFEFVDPAKVPRITEGIDMCRQRFISIAKKANRNYIVLLIDEAQDMTLREWKWLAGLQNWLEEKGYLLSIFSIGSHQLGYQHEYLASTGNAHVASRFMTSHARFHGLRSREELLYVLNGYDEDSEWPPKSGITYLQYFAPSDFSDGHRLSSIATVFWKALVELRPKSNYKYYEFPMQHVAKTVEEILFQLARGADWEEVTSYTSLLDCLTKLDFSNHMRIVSTQG